MYIYIYIYIYQENTVKNDTHKVASEFITKKDSRKE